MNNDVVYFSVANRSFFCSTHNGCNKSGGIYLVNGWIFWQDGESIGFIIMNPI